MPADMKVFEDFNLGQALVKSPMKTGQPDCLERD
jgi:hypothetical protein